MYSEDKDRLLKANTLLSLKVPEKEKYANDKEWFKRYMRWTVPTLTYIIRDYDKLKRCYDIVNNNIDGFKDEFRRFCDPLGDLDELAKEENILPFNYIHNKINIFRDGAIKRKPRHFVVPITSDAIKKKNDEWKANVQERVMQQMQQMIDIAQLPENEREQATQKFLEENLPEGFTLDTFRTAWERFYERVLRWAEFHEEIKRKKIETMDDVVIADRAILYVGWKGDKPCIEVCNPLFTGFHKSPNEAWIQKGDYVYTTRSMTAVDIMTEYGDRLTDEELLRCGVFNNGPSSSDPRFDVMSGHAVPVRQDYYENLYRENSPGQDRATRFVGQHQTNAGSMRSQYRSLIPVTHMEFKAFREVGFLNYMDELGQTVTTVVSEDFDIPKGAKKGKVTKHGVEVETWEWTEGKVPYVLEKTWIPWKYEMTRIFTDVYVDCREVPHQTVNINDPYGSFELSYKGRVFSDRNSDSISLVERALPWQFQAFYISHVINKELAKYKGIVMPIDTDQIPEHLGQDHEGNQLYDRVAVFLNYVRHGYAFYSGSQNSFGALPPSTRSQGVDTAMVGTAREIFALKQLLEIVNNEISLVMLISPQREGKASAELTATDNARDVAQSYALTEYLFDQHEEVWAVALNAYLKNFRHYYKQRFLEDPTDKNWLSYIMPDGTQDLFEVTPDHLDINDIGLFVKTGSSEQEYRQYMLQSVFSVAQNAGEGAEIVSQLVKMITEGESPDVVDRKIGMIREAQQKRIEEMEKQKMANAEKLEQMRLQSKQQDYDHEMRMLVTKEELVKQREMEVAILKTYQFQEDLNKDQDGVPDPLEALQIYEKMQNEKRKLEQGDRKLDLEAEKIRKMKPKQ